MRKLRVYSLILTVLTAAPACLAQTGSWQAVETLPSATPITIRTTHKIRCNFLGATDGTISCEEQVSAPGWAPGRGSGWARTLNLDRNSVRQVRIEHPTANTLVGTAIGVGVGAGLGAASKSGTFTPGATELIGAVFFAAFGGFAGHEIHIVPGTVIYAAPSSHP